MQGPRPGPLGPRAPGILPPLPPPSGRAVLSHLLRSYDMLSARRGIIKLDNQLTGTNDMLHGMLPYTLVKL